MKVGDLVRRKTVNETIREKIHIIIETLYDGKHIRLSDMPSNRVFSPNSLELVSEGR